MTREQFSRLTHIVYALFSKKVLKKLRLSYLPVGTCFAHKSLKLAVKAYLIMLLLAYLRHSSVASCLVARRMSQVLGPFNDSLRSNMSPAFPSIAWRTLCGAPRSHLFHEITFVRHNVSKLTFCTHLIVIYAFSDELLLQWFLLL